MHRLAPLSDVQFNITLRFWFILCLLLIRVRVFHF